MSEFETYYTYTGKPKEILDRFNYQKKLTDDLDELSDKEFTKEIIHEIVLWKVNRYPYLTIDVIDDLNTLIKLKPGEHKKGEKVIGKLLEIKGIDLPMASTILRFRNPQVFQIIDKRAYRSLYGKKLSIYGSSSQSKKISTYLDYLDKLCEICKSKKLEFFFIDRLLYQFDKENNGVL